MILPVARRPQFTARRCFRITKQGCNLRMCPEWRSDVSISFPAAKSCILANGRVAIAEERSDAYSGGWYHCLPFFLMRSAQSRTKGAHADAILWRLTFSLHAAQVHIPLFIWLHYLYVAYLSSSESFSFCHSPASDRPSAMQFYHLSHICASEPWFNV
jgi:hypothetical protein